jgi:hypothetical protein
MESIHINIMESDSISDAFFLTRGPPAPGRAGPSGTIPVLTDADEF